MSIRPTSWKALVACSAAMQVLCLTAETNGVPCGFSGREAENIRPSRTLTTVIGDRMWQTASTLDEPLVWYWPESATSAQLSVVDLLTNRSRIIAYERAETAVCGSYVVPGMEDVSGGMERLFDFSITFFAGEDALRTDTARVAYLPSADSSAVQVLRADAATWGEVVGGRVASYDADWMAETSDLTPVVYVCRAATELPGTSGYFAIRAKDIGPDENLASLSFGSVSDAWTASLKGLLPGFLLLVH